MVAGDKAEGESCKSLDRVAEAAAVRKSDREVGVSHDTSIRICMGGSQDDYGGVREGRVVGRGEVDRGKNRLAKNHYKEFS